MSPAPLPKTLYRYFWDVNPQEITSHDNSVFVIERLLEMGNVQAVEWMNKQFSRNQIEKTLKASHRISPKAANFWALMYNVPESEIACLHPSSLKIHNKLWPQ